MRPRADLDGRRINLLSRVACILWRCTRFAISAARGTAGSDGMHRSSRVPRADTVAARAVTREATMGEQSGTLPSMEGETLLVPSRMHCAGCGEAFTQSRVKHECCSAACRVKWWRKRRRANAHFHCAWCDRDVARCKGRSYQRFCDRACRRAWESCLRSKARRAARRWKWGAVRIAEWLSTPAHTVKLETVRRWLGRKSRQRSVTPLASHPLASS
jgi:hypothetical protein